MVEHIDELPRLKGAKDVYLDVETTTFGDKEKNGLNPWTGSRITGFSITVDDHPGAWYVPLRHRWGVNIDVSAGLRFASDILGSCKRWINHNAKFDAHFLAADGVEFKCELVCTLTLAKLIDSDRLAYGLDTLSKSWLDEDIGAYEERLKPYSGKQHDHGAVPSDIEAEYSCQDVITNRKLYAFLFNRRPRELEWVWNNEILLTPVIFDIEQVGIPVDITHIKLQEYRVLSKLSVLEERLHSNLGFVMRPHTNTDCFEVICNQFGLPVLGRTDKSEPSFAADVLKEYLELSSLPDQTRRVIKDIMEYRKLHTLLTMFITPYQNLTVDGVMHPNYNQSVRTGRMSCSNPNAQQLSYEAKKLILVPEDEIFWFWDYSQIEFRLIAHYCKIESAIQAYLTDPNTDYHEFVATMCKISRAPAKNVNFGTAFGAGRPKVESMLRATPEIINEMMGVTEELIRNGTAKEEQRKQLFDSLCAERSSEVYDTYHGTFPEIKSTYYRAEQVARSRGYVYNLYGRRRHLLPRFAYKGFNAIIQGSAADIFKEALIKTAPRYDRTIRESGMKQFSMIHDEVGFRGPRSTEEDEQLKTYIEQLLCDPSVPIRVPISASFSATRSHWGADK